MYALFFCLSLQYVYSKGTVLDKTVEYLKELMSQNEQLAATAKLAEKSANALSVLQNQIAVLEKENAFLRAQIIQFGIDAAASGSQASGKCIILYVHEARIYLEGGSIDWFPLPRISQV